MAEQITDHSDAAVARLPEAHKDKENIELLITAVAAQTQEAENAWWQLFAERQIDTAIGQQLDDIGAIVGEARQGRSDDDYRRYICTRISANNSEGRISDLVRVARSVLNDDSLTIRFEAQYPAGLVLHVESGLLDDGVASILVSFMRDTSAGGVTMQMHYMPADPDNTFTMGQVQLLGGPGFPFVNIGSTYLELGDTSGLEDTGTLVIEPGEAAEETVTYTSKDASNVYLAAPTVNVHTILLSSVKVADSATKGFAEDDTPSTGGYFSSILE